VAKKAIDPMAHTFAILTRKSKKGKKGKGSKKKKPKGGGS